MIIRNEYLESKPIYIIDQMIDKSEIDNFYSFAKNLSYTRNERDNNEDVYPIFSVDFIPEVLEQDTHIGRVARDLLDKFYRDNSFKLVRSYINMSHYGDMEYPHHDCHVQSSDITILYYVNSVWDYTWGGETIFYENGDSRIAVLPQPGRFVVFPGAIEHLGSIPSRACSHSRLSLALKYRVSN